MNVPSPATPDESTGASNPVRGLNGEEEHFRGGKRIRRMLLLFVVVPYVVVTLLAAVFQRRLIYHPTRADRLLAASSGLTFQAVRDVQIEADDNVTLHGWLLAHPVAKAEEKPPLVLYFPGNAAHRKQRSTDLHEMARAGFDVLIFDYRGYGDSGGKPSEAALTSDARLIWDYARRELGYPESRIVLFGESIGGAVLLSLWAPENANPPRPVAVMLQSTFTSLPAVAGWHYPQFPFRFLLMDRWSSLDRIGRVKEPVIIFHGRRDDIVPFEHGQQLTAAASNARLIDLPEAGHNDIPVQILRQELVRLKESLNDQGKQR